MNKKSSLVAYGLISLALVAGIFLSVKSVNQTQDTRSSATGEQPVGTKEVIDGVCGSGNGKTLEFLPSDEESCEIGAINWYDSEGTDGEYNWSCIGTYDGKIDDCTATVNNSQ
jgi:hypothetical protein